MAVWQIHAICEGFLYGVWSRHWSVNSKSGFWRTVFRDAVLPDSQKVLIIIESRVTGARSIRALISSTESVEPDRLGAAALIPDDWIRFSLHYFSPQPWCYSIWKLNIVIPVMDEQACLITWADKNSLAFLHGLPTVPWGSLSEQSICGNVLSLLAIPFCYSFSEFHTHEAVTN